MPSNARQRYCERYVDVKAKRNERREDRGEFETFPFVLLCASGTIGIDRVILVRRARALYCKTGKAFVPEERCGKCIEIISSRDARTILWSAFIKSALRSSLAPADIALLHGTKFLPVAQCNRQTRRMSLYPPTLPRFPPCYRREFAVEGTSGSIDGYRRVVARNKTNRYRAI